MKGKPLVNVQIRAELEVSELFDRTMEEHDIPTRGRFLELLLEKYLNPKTQTVEVSDPELTAKLEDALHEVSRLQSERAELAERNQELTTSLNLSGIIPPGQILFTVSEAEQQVLENIKPRLKQKGFEGTNEEALYVAIRHGLIDKG